MDFTKSGYKIRRYTGEKPFNKSKVDQVQLINDFLDVNFQTD